jgi:hypothetical protein
MAPANLEIYPSLWTLQQSSADLRSLKPRSPRLLPLSYVHSTVLWEEIPRQAVGWYLVRTMEEVSLPDQMGWRGDKVVDTPKLRPEAPVEDRKRKVSLSKDLSHYSLTNLLIRPPEYWYVQPRSGTHIAFTAGVRGHWQCGRISQTNRDGEATKQQTRRNYVQERK